MARLHVTVGRRVVALHIDLIVGKSVLGHRKDLCDQPVGGSGETIGVDDLTRAIGARGQAQQNVDLVGKDRAEEFPVVRVNANRIAGDRFLDLLPIDQPPNFLAIRHNLSSRCRPDF
jgi:hypothetical protein